MDIETLNDFPFADLVTRWAAQIARARASSMGDAPWSGAGLSVSTEDLQSALAQLEMRRGVVQGFREPA